MMGEPQVNQWCPDECHGDCAFNSLIGNPNPKGFFAVFFEPCLTAFNKSSSF